MTNPRSTRVDAVKPGQWDVESLPGWTVADLVAHLVNEQLWVPPLLAGEPYDMIDGRFPEDTEDLLGSLLGYSPEQGVVVIRIAKPDPKRVETNALSKNYQQGCGDNEFGCGQQPE